MENSIELIFPFFTKARLHRTIKCVQLLALLLFTNHATAKTTDLHELNGPILTGKVMSLSQCGRDEYVIGLASGVFEEALSNQNWNQRQVTTKEATQLTCSEDGKVLIVSTADKRYIYFRSGGNWNLSKELPLSGSDSMLVSGFDFIAALPTAYFKAKVDSSGSIYRIKNSQLSITKVTLDFGPVFEFSKKNNVIAQMMDAETSQESGDEVRLRLVRVLLFDSKKIALFFDFSDARQRYVAWGDPSNGIMTVAALPRDSDPWMTQKSGIGTLIMGVRRRADAANSNQSVPFNFYRCEMHSSLTCAPYQIENGVNADGIVAMSGVNTFLSEDITRHCYEILSPHRSADKCWVLPEKLAGLTPSLLISGERTHVLGFFKLPTAAVGDIQESVDVLDNLFLFSIPRQLPPQ